MKNLSDLEKKINSELGTKIKSTKINHKHICINIENENLLEVVLFLKNNNETKFRQLVQPVEFIAKPLKSITIRCSAIDSLCHGAQLAIPGILKISKGISKHDNISILSQKGELIALADALLSSDDIVNNKKGIACSTKRVIMKPDTYPKLWKNTEND